MMYWASGLLALLTAATLGLSVGSARAQSADTFAVDTTVDAPDAAPDGVCAANLPSAQRCSLRAAIMEANALGGPQTIQVPVGTYRLTIQGRNEGNSRTGDLNITSDISLVGMTGASKARPIIDATGLGDRVLSLQGQVLIQNLVTRGGDARDDENHEAGGGISIFAPSVVRIEASVIENNAALFGAGISIGHDSRLTVLDSVIRNNVATDAGGGIFSQNGIVVVGRTTISGNQARRGAGVLSFKDSSTPRQVRLIQSAIIGNHATAEGGGVLVGKQTTIVVGSSTVSGNTAQGGGGIYVEGDLGLSSSTVAQNSNNGVFVLGNVNANNSIIANNAGFDCVFSSGIGVITGVGNLSGGQSCHFEKPDANLSNRNPLLGPLALNGGTTQTHALLPGSPAIDAGVTECSRLPDQRGVERPQGARCDIGAYEVAASELPPTATPSATPRAPKATPTPIISDPLPPRPTVPTE
jgi:CSLREA domain-containing protein